jgi:sulfite reductase (NADPH) flavoprotein alpha-component
MNQMTPPAKLEVIPSSAPFSESQRSWLNGFFAGLLSMDGSAQLSPEQRDAVLQEASAADGEQDEAPWHDQTMPLADRHQGRGASQPLCSGGQGNRTDAEGAA